MPAQDRATCFCAAVTTRAPETALLPSRPFSNIIHPFFPPFLGLLGDGVQYLLDTARKRVMQPGAVVVPAAATVYCMGIEAWLATTGGFDVTPLNRYRWDNAPQNVRLSDFPHRVLTQPAKAAEFFFDGEKRGRVRCASAVGGKGGRNCAGRVERLRPTPGVEPVELE